MKELWVKHFSCPTSATFHGSHDTISFGFWILHCTAHLQLQCLFQMCTINPVQKEQHCRNRKHSQTPSHVTLMPLVAPNVPVPYRILAPAEVLCFSSHSEAWRCKDGRATALWKSREPPLPTEGHRRTGLEDLQNSILGRKAPFPFSAGYFGCFSTPKAWSASMHLAFVYRLPQPAIPPSHTQTRLLKITNESIHFYLATWP